MLTLQANIIITMIQNYHIPTTVVNFKAPVPIPIKVHLFLNVAA